MNHGISAILVSVQYTDLLALTLPYNRHHFYRVTIVTTDEDYPNLAPLAQAYEAQVLTTDLFYRNGATFNKWAALEAGLDWMGRGGWICLMDADVLWPKHAPLNLVPGRLYSPLRRMFPIETLAPYNPSCKTCGGRGAVEVTDKDGVLNQRFQTSIPCPERCTLPYPPESLWTRYPIHRNIHEWAGYTQVFHASDPVLGSPPWHEVDWKHAGGADSFFQRKWTPDKKVRPEWQVLHLGEAGQNWMGRATPLLSGERLKEAADRNEAMRQLWARRVKAGRGQFGHERLGGGD